MRFTAEHIKHFVEDWSRTAGEPIEVSLQPGMVLYGYGSELGALRIFRSYNRIPGDAITGATGPFPNSTNGRWFFRLPLTF